MSGENGSGRDPGRVGLRARKQRPVSPRGSPSGTVGFALGDHDGLGTEGVGGVGAVRGFGPAQQPPRKQRTAVRPKATTINQKEKKILQDVLRSTFLDPQFAEETYLTDLDVASVVDACHTEATASNLLDTVRLEIFDEARIKRAFNAFMVSEWDLDLPAIRKNHKATRQVEANLGINPAELVAQRELLGSREQDKAEAEATIASLTIQVTECQAEINPEDDIIENTFRACTRFEKLLLTFTALNSLHTVPSATLIELKSQVEVVLYKMASKMPEKDACATYTREKGLATHDQFEAQHEPAIAAGGGAGTPRPGGNGVGRRKTDVNKLSLSSLLNSLRNVAHSTLKAVHNFTQRLDVVHRKSEESTPTQRAKKARRAVPTPEQVLAAEVAVREAKTVLINRIDELRDLQALAVPIVSADETVASLCIIVPPSDEGRSQSNMLYSSGEALSPLLEAIIIHSIAPQSSRKKIVDKLLANTAFKERYRLAPEAPAAPLPPAAI